MIKRILTIPRYCIDGVEDFTAQNEANIARNWLRILAIHVSGGRIIGKFFKSMPMFKLFARYVSVGVVNTAIHWGAFYVILHTAGVSQSLANFGAFCIAVTFSFFANARWTFDSETTTLRYMLYVIFMGSMAAFIGWVADVCSMPIITTLVGFSAISLVCGFIYSKYIVFRESK